MTAKTIYFHALSPLHIGSGRGTGLIDLPIARERATGMPILPGSSIKGVIRDEAERRLSKEGNKEELINTFFGSADPSAVCAGAFSFSDAYLLCLPVRAFKGTFAWVTCPQILKRYARDFPGQASRNRLSCDFEGTTGDAFVHSDRKIWTNENDGKVVLEDLNFTCKINSAVDGWINFLTEEIFVNEESWKAVFKDRFVVVSDEVFNYLAKHCTEVRARIRINDETKIVAAGALWYEESLPAETLLVGLAWQDDALRKGNNLFETLKKLILDKELQFGGKSTTGLGRMRVFLGE